MSTTTRTVWSDIVAGAQNHMQGVEWSMNGTISMLRRRWGVLAASITVCLGLAILLLVVMKPQYTAETMLQINTRTEQVTKMDDVVSSLSSSDPAIRTEVDVLSSRKLASRIIEKMGLLDDADNGGGILSGIKNAVSLVFSPAPNEAKMKEDRDAKMSRAVNHLLANLEVAIIPRSYSILVRYQDPDPKKAAAIANSVAQEYLNSQLEDKFEATRRANAWMSDRLQKMQKSVLAAEMAAEKFREANNLTAAKGILLSEQQLSELNTQLILARTELAETQAKYNQSRKLQLKGRGIESAQEVLTNELISRLREQEAQVRRDMADLASRYGERHPRMITVRNQLGDIQRKINEEINKIQGSLENNVAVSQARVNTLQEQLDALSRKNGTRSDANIQLAELERQSDAEKSLYESFLSRSKEISQMSFVQTDARVISAAEVPLQPSSPKKLLILIAALFAGTALGVALMMLLEILDAGFRTSAQLESELETPLLGLLAELKDVKNMATYVVDKPSSAFTEGIRAVRTAMKFANPDKPSQITVVSSSVPEEGKSLFALSLAQLSAHGDAKILLVDGDLRRPSIARQLKLKPKVGFGDVLNGDAKAKDAIIVMPDTGLHVLPSLPNTKFSQELLSSPKMEELLVEWRKTYDMVVIDSPPVMAVADAVTLAGMSDVLLFMVRWGSTPRALAANAIKTLKACHAPLVGCVMTRVDLEKQTTYSPGEYGYYHGKYKGYYSE